MAQLGLGFEFWLATSYIPNPSNSGEEIDGGACVIITNLEKNINTSICVKLNYFENHTVTLQDILSKPNTHLF